MIVNLAFGRSGLEIAVPDDASIVAPVFLPGLEDETAAIRQSLRQPIASPALRDLLDPSATVAIVFSDITRPVPNRLLLPPILVEIEEAGVPTSSVTLINACGMHRPNTPDELDAMLGPKITATYRIVNHDARDSNQLAYIGKSSFGREVWVNKNYLQASVRILTGFIEPHFFAGFSGGAKSVLPGIAGSQTIMRNHNAAMVGHPQARWGVTDENPIFSESRQAEAMAPCSFVVNVALNERRRITGVFAGGLKAAHDAGIAFVRKTAMRSVHNEFDIVVTTNSGYPLDLNLYQAVKGMSAAAEIVRPGGDIIIASECSEGVGHGNFAAMLGLRSSPREMLDLIESPGFLMFDQWEAQILAKILLKSRVHIFATGLSQQEARAAFLQPWDSVERAILTLAGQHKERSGRDPRICILPQGPQTVPYVAYATG
ncbi:MAG: nickel-dependent lactate racemase [Dehalococcoidia bacterium]|nr:nickel-dependent lactate racemase [Dehalococcoidia bacterium]